MIFQNPNTTEKLTNNPITPQVASPPAVPHLFCVGGGCGSQWLPHPPPKGLRTAADREESEEEST